MPKTHRRVRITHDHPQASVAKGPVVLVDDELLYGVTEINYRCKYSEGMPRVQITLMGVDVDLEGAPEYLVRVVGPGPKQPEEKSADA